MDVKFWNISYVKYICISQVLKKILFLNVLSYK